jgi:secondary thiamine-phosphate synthase enzyme
LNGEENPVVEIIEVITKGQGLWEITEQVTERVTRQNLEQGLCTLFVRHTSCSLVIQENADPSAKRDLEHWLNRLVPENDPLYTHTFEGADDMPAHIKAALTASSIAIPILKGKLTLGTWQGIYLWEHRRHSHRRQVVIHIGS